MTTRSQKRKAVAELVSGDFETSITENFPPETLVASSSKIPRIEPENLAEIKTSLRKEIMSDLTKILAENQKEMLKLIAPLNKKQTVYMNAQDSDSEPENVSVARTSTPVKIHTATNSKTTPVISRNMVTGVLNDSTNQPAKRPKQQRAPNEQTKDRPSTSKILFAPQPQTFPATNLLPMPKALSASLPVFDGKSEKFELFEDLFRNNIKMYPHLTEIQKINYFHSLLRGNALQAYCNLDDTKKDNLEEVITAFKRRFGVFQSSAKARCEWDALHFDPTKQKLHEFLDALQKTAKEAFGSEAQKFIDKAIYAKMPDHVKKILNRAYLEDKPYNDIVLHLEREMRLNRLGAPGETTLVPSTLWMQQWRMIRKNNSREVTVSTVGNTDITRHNAVASAKTGTTPQKQVPQTPNQQIQLNPNAILVEKCTKPKIAGTEPMGQMTPGNANVSSLSQQTRLTNNPYLRRRPKQKTEVAAPTLRGKSRREGVHHRRPPI